MSILQIEIGYTDGEEAQYQDLADAIPATLQQLGLETRIHFMPSQISGYSSAPYDGDLRALMSGIIEHSRVRRNAESAGHWYIHLLITAYHAKSYLGVMYDSIDNEQGQGCAVFYGAIREKAGNSADAARLLLRSSLHEIGHCLNLNHRPDKTLMAQTKNIDGTPGWIRNILFAYHQSDCDYVINNPREAKPGGHTYDDGATQNDSFADNGKFKLSISFNDFRSKGKFVFHLGDPVSFLVKFTNRDHVDVKLALPLDVNGENLEVQLTGPDGKTVRRNSVIKGCGSGVESLVISKNEFRLLSVTLFADANGYLFKNPGDYKIRIRIRTHEGLWFMSRAVRITMKIQRRAKKLPRNTEQFLGGFLESGGSPAISDRKKAQRIAKGPISAELKRAIQWCLTYHLKQYVDGRKKGGSTRAKAQVLSTLQRSILKLDKSPIRKGKILKDYLSTAALLTGRSPKLTSGQKSCMNAYEKIESKLIRHKSI